MYEVDKAILIMALLWAERNVLIAIIDKATRERRENASDFVRWIAIVMLL